MKFTTLADVLEAFASTAETILGQTGSTHVGDVATRDVGRGFKLAVFPQLDRGVDHEGYSRRTAKIVIKLIAVDDPSNSNTGTTQLLRLVRLFDPLYFGLLKAAEAKTDGFTDMELLVQDDPDTPGISADGYDDTSNDRRARVGAAFQAIYNRQLSE